MGDTITLKCVSRGGNPLAQLVWFKNGDQIDFSYSTTNRESINTYSFQVDATDNNALYKCEASNSITTQPLATTVKFLVQFAPSKLTIIGAKEAKTGDTLTMTCLTDKSNPAAEVSWVVDGRPVPAKSSVTASSEGGWVTTSEVTATVSGQERTMMFSCYATHLALGTTIVETAMVNILYPPNMPSILGYSDGTSIRAGNLQRLTCICMGGNPLATLTWFKGSKTIPSTNSVSGNIASAEIAIVTEASDNEADYRCEASNTATEKALSVSTRLTVHFPSSGVHIKITPKNAKAGRKITLQCDSSSSNPESTLTWWKGGYLVQGKPNGTTDGPHGGKSSRSILRLDVTSEDDGALYTCQATNEMLQQSVHNAVTLSILYKPIFVSPPNDVVNIREGEEALINMTARGNPSSINYTWVKRDINGDSKIIAYGAILNMTLVKREHGAIYLVEAKNDEGLTRANFTLVVQYPAKVMKISKSLLVDEGGNAHFECEIDANPKPSSSQIWKRDGYDMSARAKQSTDGNKAFLSILSITKDDSGNFTCFANNGIGDPSQMSTGLMVKFRPIMNTSPEFQKAASEKGQRAKLKCRAEGTPQLTFTWIREGTSITLGSNNVKYQMNTVQTGLIVAESELIVNEVKFKDYGIYECMARNEIGYASTEIRLEGTSHPDVPLAIKVLNVSHNTVWLSWNPGFDGGLTQSFRIRYKDDVGKAFQYWDVDPSDVTMYGIGNLMLATEYSFSIMAYNTLGESEYTSDVVKAKTLSELPPSEQKTTLPPYIYEKVGEIPRIAIISVSVLGMFLAVLNVFLLVWCIQRQRKKRMEEAAESDQSSSKTAATIEMYAPSSYTGTGTGETLSSISEKSESYSDENSIVDYNDDSTSKVATTTYLTDRPETTVSTVFPTATDTSQYLTVRDVNPGSRHNTLTRTSPKINNNQNLYQHEPDNNYADELRRNAYNQNLGDKVNYNKTPPSPTKVPVGDGYFNIAPESRYIPYPPAVSPPPPRQPTAPTSAAHALSTFNPNILVPAQQTLPPELQGHLV
uniref:Nephrin n=1 Tax=Strigamia maritima TaxID=126957 RepID=T1IZV2_STRMM